MEITLLYLTRWRVLAEFDIGGDVPLCSAGRRDDLVIQRVCFVTKDALGDSPSRYRLAVTYAC
jgi:hypothetical protein